MSDTLNLQKVLQHKYVPGPRDCLSCAYCYRASESWELDHIYWYECNARPANAMLKQFPFKNTSCKLFKIRKRLEGQDDAT